MGDTCRHSILEDSALDVPMLEESSSRGFDDGLPSPPLADPPTCGTPHSDGGTFHTHRLQNFVHKISSFGSATVSGMGDSSDSSSLSEVFGHRQG